MANAISDKKGIDIVTIRMRKMSAICDYFVIASGTSTTQVRAISDHVVKTLRAKGENPRHVEGEREASWVIVDFGDVVGHIFLGRTREFYGLEKLWSKAPQEKFREAPLSKIKRAIKKKRTSLKRPAKKIAKKSVKKSKKKKNR